MKFVLDMLFLVYLVVFFDIIRTVWLKVQMKSISSPTLVTGNISSPHPIKRTKKSLHFDYGHALWLKFYTMCFYILFFVESQFFLQVFFPIRFSLFFFLFP